MVNVSYEKVKTLIELSTTVEEADEIINKYCCFESIREKVAFLKGMFDVSIVGHENDEPDETTYISMLSGIVNAKWN